MIMNTDRTLAFCLREYALALTAGCLLLGVATGCRTAEPGSGALSRPGVLASIVTEADFRGKVLESGRPVVAVFHTPDCGFCRSMIQRMEKDMVAFGPDARIYLVNIRDLPQLRAQYDVGPVPTTLFFVDGRERDRWTGSRPGFYIRSKFGEFFGQ